MNTGKSWNPPCANCGHVRSAHDFDAQYRHKRCSHGDADGMCDCPEFTPKDGTDG